MTLHKGTGIIQFMMYMLPYEGGLFMVMIKVPECGQEISGKVQKGTYCGKVLLRRTKKEAG